VAALTAVAYLPWLVIGLPAGVLLLTRGIRTRWDLPGAPAGRA
jgi:hypothetical protein